jgi:phosphoribosylamine--glycine ligase
MSDSVLDEIGTTVFAPVLHALRERGAPFVGALYAGMMITSEGPRVLELNCRLGDPETQVLMMRLATDPGPLFAAAAAGDLKGKNVGWKSEAAVGVVLATEGYPVSPSLGDPIEGLDSLELGETLQVFQAGTREHGGQLFTAGGRVLTITALGKDVWAARDRAYAAASQVTFAGMQLRHDIASLA